jgi:cytidine deaminase
VRKSRLSRAEAEGTARPPGFDPDKLLELARRSRNQAYAPYSGFKVGAAVMAGRSVFRGANIENASYSATICAERVAAVQAVTAGIRDIWAVAISSSSVLAVAPCGVCRQFLFEFNPDMTVVSEGTGGERRTWKLSDLLPDGFEPKHLTQAE